MTDVKQDGLKEVKDLLEIINNKVGHLDVLQSASSATIRLLKVQQSVINEKMDIQVKN
jgi:hypothetical protein